MRFMIAMHRKARHEHAHTSFSRNVRSLRPAHQLKHIPSSQRTRKQVVALGQSVRSLYVVRSRCHSIVCFFRLCACNAHLNMLSCSIHVCVCVHLFASKRAVYALRESRDLADIILHTCEAAAATAVHAVLYCMANDFSYCLPSLCMCGFGSVQYTCDWFMERDANWSASLRWRSDVRCPPLRCLAERSRVLLSCPLRCNGRT